MFGKLRRQTGQCGGMVIAVVVRDEDHEASSDMGRRMGLSSSASGIGRKGTETLGRIRDAAVSLALERAVDVVNDLLPGFREQYERP